jgi:hypothetical protein
MIGEEVVLELTDGIAHLSPSDEISHEKLPRGASRESVQNLDLRRNVRGIEVACAAILLPWRQKDAYNGSPIAKYQIAGVPMISIAGVVFAGFLIWSLYKWLQDATYGLNSHTSLVFLGILYLGSVLIYVGSRVIRKREGVDLSAIHQEIPVE